MTDRDEIARLIDEEAWKAIEDGRDALPESLWYLRRRFAYEKADRILAAGYRKVEFEPDVGESDLRCPYADQDLNKRMP